MSQRNGQFYDSRSGYDARSSSYESFANSNSAGYDKVSFSRTARPRTSFDSYSRYSGSYGGNVQDASGVSGSPSASKHEGSVRPFLVIVVGVVCIVVGFLLCFFFLNGSFKLPDAVSSPLSERNLDQVVATYRYNGTLYEVSARDVIRSSSRLSDFANGDGTYDVPSSEDVIACVRNEILAMVVEEKNISVSESDVSSYAQSVFGTSDFATISQQLGMDEEDARLAVQEAAAVNKLRLSLSGSGSSEPVAPTLPADGNVEVGNSSYFDYIVSLLGSYWDSAHGTWADTNNPYYAALKDAVFAPGSASYNAAQAAYSVAYSLYTSGSVSEDEWTSFVNGYLKSCSIRILTLGI